MADNTFQAGWDAAREIAQRTGSVPPVPPEDDEFYEGGYLRNERDVRPRGQAEPGPLGTPGQGERGETAVITEEEFREQTFDEARDYAEAHGVSGRGWDDLVEGLREVGVIEE